MAYFVSTPPVQGAPGEIHTSALNALGAKATDDSGKEYIYLKGIASTVTGSPVTFDENGITGLADGNGTDDVAVGPVAIATAAVTTNQYGWYGRVGAFTVVSVTTADNARVFLTTTAGTLDDAEVDDYQIIGAVWRSSGDGTGIIQIHNPWIGLAVDASA